MRSCRVRPVTSLLLKCIKGRKQGTRCSFSISFRSQAPVSPGFKYHQFWELYRKEALGGHCHCVPRYQQGSSSHPFTPWLGRAPGALWPPKGLQAGSGDPQDKMHGVQHSPLGSAPGLSKCPEQSSALGEGPFCAPYLTCGMPCSQDETSQLLLFKMGFFTFMRTSRVRPPTPTEAHGDWQRSPGPGNPSNSSKELPRLCYRGCAGA